MHVALNYLKFLAQSFHLHGIHSPFVYQLEQECLRDSKNREVYAIMQEYRNALSQNNETICITDLGAGSQYFKGQKRTIKNILRYSSASIKKSQLLYRIASYFKAKQILELGTNLGVSTHALSLSNYSENITSIEGCKQLQHIAKTQLSSFEVEGVTLIQSSFEEALSTLNQSWDLVFMDGHHNREATLAYFDTLLPSMHKDSIIIIDDIYWSSEMQTAWEEIKNKPEVIVSVDLFFMGLVFFRTEQAKEDFKIRL